MTVELKIPEVGESIQEVHIAHWLKREGDHVSEDEDIVELETDKAAMELAAPVTGVIKEIVKDDGEEAAVGETIAVIEDDSDDQESAPQDKGATEETAKGARKKGEQAAAKEPSNAKKREKPGRKDEPRAEEEKGDKRKPPDEKTKPSEHRGHGQQRQSPEEVPLSGQERRRADVERLEEGRSTRSKPTQERKKKPDSNGRHSEVEAKEKNQQPPDEHVVPLSPIRKRIAQRLVKAQQEAALLTTFNEADMSAVIELRQKYGEAFSEKHGVKLGFMSFFVRATVEALRAIPQLNAEIRGDEMVLHDSRHIGIAIATERGLVVPVLRSAEQMNYADIERFITDFAARANSGKLEPAELQGGTFTISNGGVFGSLLSTPIVNPPQSGVLGMHAIEERPVGRDGQIVLRPMMYLALTYDHRLVDGREAITFLKQVTENVENPVRMLLDV